MIFNDILIIFLSNCVEHGRARDYVEVEKRKKKTFLDCDHVITITCFS